MMKLYAAADGFLFPTHMGEGIRAPCWKQWLRLTLFDRGAQNPRRGMVPVARHASESSAMMKWRVDAAWVAKPELSHATMAIEPICTTLRRGKWTG